jgi:hypothetical protein
MTEEEIIEEKVKQSEYKKKITEKRKKKIKQSRKK